MFLKRKALWITIAVVAVLLGSTGGGYVLAKTNLNPVSANGTISAAYQKNTGTLRLVNGKSDVLPSEKYIQWNQTGPQGVGIAGAVNNGDGTFTLDFTDGTSFTTPDLTGPQGPQGETGAAGVGIAGVVNNGDGTFTLNFTDGTSFTTANLTGPQGLPGETGAAGVGIAGVVSNGDGTFSLNFTNGTSFTTPDFTGPQGPQGKTGAAGVGIAGVVNNGDGTFTLNFTDGTSFTTANLTGPRGLRGEQGTAGVGVASAVNNGDGTFTLNFTDGTSFTTANLTGPQGLPGEQGKAGVGIAGVTDNGNGTFTLEFTDSSTFTTPDLTGPQGKAGAAGVGIAGAVNNGDGTFTLEFTDNSTFTTANLTGPQGPQGKRGKAGTAVLSGTGAPWDYLLASGSDSYIGDFYIDTSANEIYGPETSSGWGTGTSLVGPQGKRGKDGTAVLSGTGAPWNYLLDSSGSDSYDGDFYIDTSANEIYGPKTSSGWGTGTSLVGPQGPAGSTSSMTPLQIATLHWYNASQVASVNVPYEPAALCFDGANVWVAQNTFSIAEGMEDGQGNEGFVTNINAASGNLVSTHGMIVVPSAICFDGTHLWVSSAIDPEVYEINAATGKHAPSPYGYRVGKNPVALCFDGAHIWTANKNSNTVSEIDVASGTVVTYPVGIKPDAICFDGTHIWVADYGDSALIDFQPPNITSNSGSTGTLNYTTTQVNLQPKALCFDGTNIWAVGIPESGSASLGAEVRLNITTGEQTDYTLGNTPTAVCFDGAHIWFTNTGSNKVIELDASTGAEVGSYATGENPDSICFDGAFVWVSCKGDGTINKY